MVEIKRLDDEKGNKRIPWIDIAKGFSILFIVLGHASSGFLHYFCFSFNSIIFFILSGMAFCRIKDKPDAILCFDDRKSSEFIKKNVRKILQPYFIWGGVSIALYYLLEGLIVSHFRTGSNIHFALFSNIMGLLYGNSDTGFFEYYKPLWFLPCLLVVEIIWFFLLKIMYRTTLKRAWALYGIFMAIFVLFGIVESYCQWNLILPFETESAVFMSFFFGIGLLLRSRGKQFYQRINLDIKKRTILLFLIWLSVAFYGTYLNGNTDVRSDYFSNIWIFIFNSLWISMGMIYMSVVVQRCVILEYLGKRTMAILVLHKYPIMFFRLFSYIQTEMQEGNPIIEILVTLLTILLCLMVERVISRFCPQLFG